MGSDKMIVVVYLRALTTFRILQNIVMLSDKEIFSWALKPGQFYATPLIPGAPPSFTAFNAVISLVTRQLIWHSSLFHNV